jgi:hypothetical protein
VGELLKKAIQNQETKDLGGFGKLLEDNKAAWIELAKTAGDKFVEQAAGKSNQQYLYFFSGPVYRLVGIDVKPVPEVATSVRTDVEPHVPIALVDNVTLNFKLTGYYHFILTNWATQFRQEDQEQNPDIIRYLECAIGGDSDGGFICPKPNGGGNQASDRASPGATNDEEHRISALSATSKQVENEGTNAKPEVGPVSDEELTTGFTSINRSLDSAIYANNLAFHLNVIVQDRDHYRLLVTRWSKINANFPDCLGHTIGGDFQDSDLIGSLSDEKCDRLQKCSVERLDIKKGIARELREEIGIDIDPNRIVLQVIIVNQVQRQPILIATCRVRVHEVQGMSLNPELTNISAIPFSVDYIAAEIRKLQNKALLTFMWINSPFHRVTLSQSVREACIPGPG